MVVVVDYNAGNLTSVKLALEYLNIKACITRDPQKILSANHVIFPGVGAAASAMHNLLSLNLIEPLKEVVARGTPFLGICLGTQVIFEFSEENGGTSCLGIIPGIVRRFDSHNGKYKIPQIGWNTVQFTKPEHPLFKKIENESEFYFVHSYYPMPTDKNNILGTTNYAEVDFASVVGKNNLVATQFHPERSGRIGLQLLKNFCEWNGKC